MFFRSFAAGLAAVLCLAFPHAAVASTVNLIENGSFEEADLSNFLFGDTTPGVICDEGTARTGSCSVGMLSLGDPTDPASNQFFYVEKAVPAGTYVLEAWVSVWTAAEAADFQSISPTRFEPTLARLLALPVGGDTSGGNTFVDVNARDFPLVDATDNDQNLLVLPTRTDWFRMSVTSTFDTETQVLLGFVGRNQYPKSSGNVNATLFLVDDISLTSLTPVPLPAAGWALLAGLGLLAGLSRRRGRAAGTEG